LRTIWAYVGLRVFVEFFLIYILTLACSTTHLQAVLFDLSAETLDGKYLEKKGPMSVEGLVSKVFKLAKTYQPAVIFIDDATRMFGKKKVGC
jgi:ATP-dependent 26S proteasome regulatory subunit